MLEKIYEVIKNNKSVTFEEVHQQFSRQIKNRKDFSGYLKNLEAGGQILYYNQRYYDLKQFPKAEGYINWNMTGFCWLTPEQQTNAYGLAFDSSTELNSIYNKKQAFYGHKAVGYQVSIEDNNFFVIYDAIPAQDVKLIATYKEKHKEWIALNGAPIFNFPNSQIKNFQDEEVQRILNGAKEGEIVEFTYHQNGALTLDKHLGHINQYGMETKILKALTSVSKAPKLNTANINFEQLEKSNTPFYTIDDINTKDIDDAIFCEKTASGWKLSVAIADVSSFIKHKDEQDKHAQSNSISFYFPHEVNHLIDRALAEDFCSLNPGQPKQSMICEVDINQDGSIAGYNFKHQEIISHARLTYNDVDSVIEGGNPSESKFFNGKSLENLTSFDQIPAIKESLKQLHSMVQTQKFHRERDYFVVETPEYDLDSFGKISHLYFSDENKPSQKMVETSMLLANVCTAKFTAEKLNGLGMFRNQVPPKEGEFPKPAKYAADNIGHWGLGLTHYTHFTSPIRRYCDLVNHRLVKDIINNNTSTYTAEEINKISENINAQQYIEKQIANKSKQLLLPQYVQRLQETNTLDKQLSIVDVTDSGVVYRNSQLIEFFTPYFKIDEELRNEAKSIAKNNETLSRQDKENALAELNSKYSVSFEMAPFSWTDERKNLEFDVKKNDCSKKLKM